MLDHASVTVLDFLAAERFYDAVMEALGVPKVGRDADEGWIGYGQRCSAEHPERSYFSVRRGSRAEPARGRHLCFKASTRAAVEAFWRAGLARGGADEGAPGLRQQYHSTYYAAFLADPSGNRIEAVCHLAPDR